MGGGVRTTTDILIRLDREDPFTPATSCPSIRVKCLTTSFSGNWIAGGCALCLPRGRSRRRDDSSGGQRQKQRQLVGWGQVVYHNNKHHRIVDCYHAQTHFCQRGGGGPRPCEGLISSNNVSPGHNSAQQRSDKTKTRARVPYTPRRSQLSIPRAPTWTAISTPSNNAPICGYILLARESFAAE